VNEEGEDVFDKLGLKPLSDPPLTRRQKTKVFLGKTWVTICHPFVVYRFYQGVKKLEPILRRKDAEARKAIKERLEDIDKFRNRPDPITGVMYHTMSQREMHIMELWNVDQYAHVPHEVQFELGDPKSKEDEV
jgi:hypothetical protein